MRRRSLLVLAVLAVLVTAGALALPVLDRGARVRATALVAAQAQRELGLAQPPAVVIGGRWFLWQALRGRYESVMISAPTLTRDGATVKGALVSLRDVHVPHTVPLGRGGTVTIGSGSADATVPWSVLESRASIGGAKVTFSAEGPAVRAATSVSVLGRPLDLTLSASPELSGRSIVLRPQRVSLAGRELAVEDVRAQLERFGITQFKGLLDGVTVGVDQVPAGVQLRGLTVVPDGLAVKADLTSMRVPVAKR